MSRSASEPAEGLARSHPGDDRSEAFGHERDVMLVIRHPLRASAPLPERVAGPATAEAEVAARPETTPGQVRLSLERLFRAHRLVIWRTVRRLGASPEAAADFTQQAFVIAAERFAEIRLGSERAFLFSTAIGLARTSRRRESRCQLEGDMEVHARPASLDETQTRAHYARQLMDRVLSELDPDLLTVFVLFELEGFTSPEIAEIVQVPTGTVASRLRRARETFRREVARLEQGGAGASR